MKVTVPMLFAVSLAVAGMMMGMSGFDDYVGVSKSTGLEADANDLVNKSREYQASRASDSGGDYLGLTVDSTGAVVSALKWTFALPIALINVGVPSWFAWPLGAPLQLISFLGIWQIIRGMSFR